ncbi:GNAT family N-acetyltransferase [Shimazuella kribbensis]|uniref:GNAT family N-acetyltransferase n=1 Tax=Shimazuella kribbensis TaxID=139808 RepID=UPI00040FA6D2|nr:GNAT family N-acetyltransferase [Shimazuella kribbensis]
MIIKSVIRKYEESDKEAIQEICYLTGYMGESAKNFWRHKQSFVEIWMSYYIDQEPNNIIVATMDDKVVGYLTGCLSTSTGPEMEKIMYAKIVKYGLFFRLGTADFLFRAMKDDWKHKQSAKGGFIDERWPAHLHINLLPSARGTGLAAILIDNWLTRLKKFNSSGCHLSTISQNTQAIKFFKKMGFRKHGEPLVISGMRGWNGENLQQQIMVLDINSTK